MPPDSPLSLLLRYDSGGLNEAQLCVWRIINDFAGTILDLLPAVMGDIGPKLFEAQCGEDKNTIILRFNAVLFEATLRAAIREKNCAFPDSSGGAP